MAVMNAKFAGKCVKCEAAFAAGTRITWAGRGTAEHFPKCPAAPVMQEAKTGYYPSDNPLPGNGNNAEWQQLQDAWEQYSEVLF